MDISSMTSRLSSLSKTQNLNLNTNKLATSLSTSSVSKHLQTGISLEPAGIAVANKAGDLLSTRSAIYQQQSYLKASSDKTFSIQNEITDLRKETNNASVYLESYIKGDISKEELQNDLENYQASYQTGMGRIDTASKDSVLLTGGKITLTSATGGTGSTVNGTDMTSEGLKLKTKAADDTTIANADKPLVDQDVSQMVSAITGQNDTASLDKIKNALQAKSDALYLAEGTAITYGSSFSSAANTLQFSIDNISSRVDKMDAEMKQAAEMDMKDAGISALSQRTSAMLGSTGASFAGQAEMAIIKSLFK